jgi:hypothetical protein
MANPVSDPVNLVVMGAMAFFMIVMLLVSLHDLTQGKNAGD